MPLLLWKGTCVQILQVKKNPRFGKRMWIVKNAYYENTISLEFKAAGKGKQILFFDGPEIHSTSDQKIQNRPVNPEQPGCSKFVNIK